MSQWTHVSGCFRIDGLPGILPPSHPTMNIISALGHPSTDPFRGDGGTYKAADGIPSGSEGSIQYHIADAGDGAVWKTVAVWGDLRDFGAEDTPEIDAWFARVVASPLMLRSAHLLVGVEYGVRYLLNAHEKSVQRVELVAPATEEH